jgi:hypothetical protein
MRQIPSPNHGGSRGAVRWVIVHTAEGATTAAGLGSFFANPASGVSSHVGIDDHEIVQYVDYSQTAWAALDANPNSDQAELCAFAAWDRATWLTHPGMLENTAQWIADRCRARGIPAVKIDGNGVHARRPGVCGHIDITNGLGGTHTDPGGSFPWDVVMARVQQILNPSAAPRSGASIVLGDDMPTVMQSKSKPPILVVGGLFVELRTPAEVKNALVAYNQQQPKDANGVPLPVWVEDDTLANLIAQSQQAVRGGAAA